MFSCRRTPRLRPALLIAALVATCSFRSATAAGLDPLREWGPVDPAELALTAPVVEPDAHAEYLVYEEFIEDGREASAWDVHARIKLFDGVGAQQFATIHVDYPEKYGAVTELVGRTILPNGRVLPLESRAIQDQPVVTAGKEVRRRRSFALPSVTAGAVIEYRYRIEYSQMRSNGIRLDFRREAPCRRIAYYFRPRNTSEYALEYQWTPRVIEFHSPGSRLAPSNGWYRFEATNQPARFTEPDSPPPLQNTGCVLIYYARVLQRPGITYWDDLAVSRDNLFLPATRPNGEARELARLITAGARDDRERVERLAAWMRSDFSVVEHTHADSLAAHGLKLVDNGRAALAQRGGTPDAAQWAFATLARALDLPVRELLSADRTELYFHPNLQHEGFLPNRRVAVKLPEGWYAVDPGASQLDADMVSQAEEGQPALVCDRDSAFFLEMPFAEPERSRLTRTAELELAEDGTVSGEVTLEATGHFNDERQRRFVGMTGASVDTILRRELGWEESALRLSNVRIERGRPGEGRFRVRFHAEWPGVGVATARRLVLEPALLEARRPARFGAGKRRTSVAFPHAWSERDSVRIRLPDGWKVEGLQEPAPVRSPGLADYEIAERLTDGDRVLVLTRKLAVGYGGSLYVSLANFEDLRRLFDRMSELDRLTVTLVRE